MPVSNKDFSEILYDLLPAVYRQEDLKVKTNPQPLKRFLQVASVGFEEVERGVDDLQLLFQPELMPEKFLDPVGRMIGFNFPVNMPVDEKRKLLKNLPLMYKLKGNDAIFEMLARMIFVETLPKVDWSYTETTTTLRVSMVVSDFVLDIEKKRERFVELAEYFRPVNVGFLWVVEVFYNEEFISSFEVDYRKDTVKVDDNVYGVHEYIDNGFSEIYGSIIEYYDIKRKLEEVSYETFSDFSEDSFGNIVIPQNTNFLLNRTRLNSADKTLYMTREVIEDNIDGKSVFDSEHVDALLYDADIEELNSSKNEIDIEHIDNLMFDVDVEILISKDYIDGSLQTDSTIYNSETENVSGSKIVDDNEGIDKVSYDADIENSKVKTNVTDTSSSRAVIINNTLNFGIIGSTMITSKEVKTTDYNY